MKNLMKFIGLALLTITLAFTPVDKKTIVIDVSHGGHDHGASIDGFAEKDIALNIANKIKDLNRNSNVEIILTRDSDKSLTLKERTEQINDLKPAYVISLHANYSNNVNESGKEIFISENNTQKEESGNLALDLFYSFSDRNVEIKNADFYLLKNVEHPIILVELGYLTNENDRKILTNEEGQTELANEILKAIK